MVPGDDPSLSSDRATIVDPVGHTDSASSDNHAVCSNCQRPTQVKAVSAVGQFVYLRCPECGAVWSISARQDPSELHPLPKPPSDEGA
jgi:hypothetical protein